MERLQFLFEALDGMSGPAGKMSRSMRETERSIRALGKAAGHEFAQGRNSLGQFTARGGDLWKVSAALSAVKMGLVAVGAAAVVAAGAGGYGMFKFLETGVDALSFKESSLVAFETMVGTKELAADMYAQATDFARRTPFETKDVVDSFKRLMAAGFTMAETPVVFQAIGDVAALNNMSPEVMQSMTRAFGQMKGRGKLLTEELYQVLEGSNGAVNRDKVFTNLAKNLGVAKEQVAGLITAGGVSADVGIFSILETMRDQSGGQVGSKMLALSETITGLFSTIKSAPFDMFNAFTDTSGIDSFKGALINLKNVLDPTSEAGAGVRKELEGLFNDTMGSLFGDLGGDDGMARMQAGIERFRAFLVEAKPQFLAFIDAAKTLAGVVIDIADAFKSFNDNTGFIKGLAGWFNPFSDKHALGTDRMGGMMVEGAGSIIDGFVAALTNTAPADEAMDNLAQSSAKSFREPMDINSPSGLFEEYGRNTVQGYAMGIGNGLSQAQGSVASLAGVTPGGAPAGAGRGAGGVTVPVTMNVDARGVADADGMMRLVAERLPSAIADALEGMAVEAGVA